MRSVQRVAFSLLLAIILFSVFAIVSFFGLFDVLESGLYYESVRRRAADDISAVSDSISGFHTANINRFSSILENTAFRRIYAPTISSNDTLRINTILQALSNDLDFAGLRVIDANGKVQFSSFDTDFQRREDRIIYLNYGQLDPSLSLDQILLPLEQDSVINFLSTSPVLPKGGILYSLAGRDENGAILATAVFYVSSSSVESYLTKEQHIEIYQRVAPITSQGILVADASIATLQEAVDEVGFIWGEVQAEVGKVRGPREIVEDFADQGGSRVLIWTKDERGLHTGILLPGSTFELDLFLKILLLASFFVTAFLVTFLILSLRQDKSIITEDRIRRFQVSILKEFVETRTDGAGTLTQNDIEKRKSAFSAQIKKGLGKVKRDDEPQMDELISTGWDEIIGILTKQPDAEAVTRIDFADLERRIEVRMRKVLSEQSNQSHGVAAIAHVTEIDDTPELIEEIESAEEADELLEELPADDIEEVGDLAADDEAGLEEIDTLEDGAELEVPEELEELSVESLEESLEEVQELEEIDTLEDGAELEVPEELEELSVESSEESPEESLEESLEEVQELEEIDTLEDGPEIEAPEEFVEEIKSAEEANEVEELLEELPAGDIEEVGDLPADDEASLEKIDTLEDDIDREDFDTLEQVVEVEEDADPTELLSELSEESLEEGDDLGEIEEIRELGDGSGTEAMADLSDLSEEHSADGLEQKGTAAENELPSDDYVLNTHGINLLDSGTETGEELEEIESLVSELSLDEAGGGDADESEVGADFQELEEVEDLEEIQELGSEIVEGTEYEEELEELDDLDAAEETSESELIDPDAVIEYIPEDTEPAGPEMDIASIFPIDIDISADIAKLANIGASSPNISDFDIDDLEEVPALGADMGDSADITSLPDNSSLIEMPLLQSTTPESVVAEGQEQEAVAMAVESPSFDAALVLEDLQPFAQVDKSDVRSDIASIDIDLFSIEEMASQSEPVRNLQDEDSVADGSGDSVEEVTPVLEVDKADVEINTEPVFEEEELEVVRELDPLVSEALPASASGFSLFTSMYDNQSNIFERSRQSVRQNAAELQDIANEDSVQEVAIASNLMPVDEFDDLPMELDAPLVAAEDSPFLSDLIDRGVLAIVHAEQVYRELNGGLNTVEMQEGVYQVSDDAYESEGSVSDSNLKGLVEAVTSDADSGEAGSIVDILSFDDIDLTIPESGTEPVSEDDGWGSSALGFVDQDGFNYDHYASGYKPNNLGIVKSLMKISHSCGSMFAAILTEVDSVLRVKHSIGLTESSIGLMAIDPDDRCRELLLDRKYYVKVNEISEEICGFELHLGKSDKKYIDSIIYVPITIDLHSGYLILGFKPGQHSINSIVHTLNNAR